MVPFGAIVLAAGFSGRMGIPKALLPFGIDQTFIEQITEIYLVAGVENIVLVTNPSITQTVQSLLIGKSNSVLIVENEEPEKGRLHSIKIGIEQLNELPLFIQNVDNPFVTVELVQNLIAVLKPNSYVSPYYHGSGGHPILISREIAQKLKCCDLDIPLYSFLVNYEQIKMEQCNSDILVNINTPEDYRSAFK